MALLLFYVGRLLGEIDPQFFELLYNVRLGIVTLVPVEFLAFGIIEYLQRNQA